MPKSEEPGFITYFILGVLLVWLFIFVYQANSEEKPAKEVKNIYFRVQGNMPNGEVILEPMLQTKIGVRQQSGEPLKSHDVIHCTVEGRIVKDLPEDAPVKSVLNLKCGDKSFFVGTLYFTPNN